MKPLKLTMQAFGPYANKQEIDFTQLGNKTMFVISGATGAGKTTIFDGISFAIYGKASGDDRNGTDLRSQFAKDETLTEVSLAFELRGKNYFIIKSTAKEEIRGEGTTTQGAKAELYELGETETLLASNVRG
ncbi:AAA family ATPase [Anaerobacillus sp. HL2]|nr:AAA family ATPase [Anaerobacillus sp. HL2]